MVKVKVTAVGNSMGVLLPREVLNRLKAERGDTLYLMESPQGYVLSAYDPEFEEQVSAAGSLMKRYRNTLRKLAK